ncbi:MAG: hypothetical protein IT243_00425 [Bacteroidia bacterium]|nr:hypothetical protein [Bacteroidia bacterium]
MLQVCDIYNDTTDLMIDRTTILIFIKEPSCTGCKETLAEYLNKLGKKYRQYVILGKSENLLDKKIYNRYLELRFTKLLGTYFSLSYQNLTFKINQKEFVFKTMKSPFLMVISNRGKTVVTYEYQDVFIDIFIRDSFKKAIKKY